MRYKGMSEVSESYPFPTYSGILEPRHYKNIGPAIWLFLWCVSSTTQDVEKDGITWGIVLGNKPVKSSELSAQFGVDEKTIRRWISILKHHDYIHVKRAPNGIIFSVKNSKKFINKVDKNVRSQAEERTNMPDHNEANRTKMSDQPDKNVRCNKDITEINKDAVVIKGPDQIIKMAQEVESYFCEKRGRGFAVSPTDFDEIKNMLVDGITVDLIKQCIDRSFAEYVPRHKRDEIRSITYCIPRCYDEWSKMQTKSGSITGAVPPVPVALGSKSRSKSQQQLDDLQKFIEEERLREAIGSG